MSVWTKHYCNYQKENKILTMIPFTQTMGKMVSAAFLIKRIESNEKHLGKN